MSETPDSSAHAAAPGQAPGPEPGLLDGLFGLPGRVALVTGASSGIGAHVARLYARAGAAVALAARRQERVEAIAAEIVASGHRACALALDVLDAAAIPAAFDAAEAAFGKPVDLLFNNAGIIYTKRFVDQDPDEVDRVFDTNLRAAFRVAQEGARRMVAGGGGAIVNVASTAAFGAGGQLSSYCASKAGLVQLTRVMALELARRGVRVNALCPGNVDTDMQAPLKASGFEASLIERTPMRRFGRCDDLDGAALLLASEAGRYMTGVALPVDGGQLLSWM